MPAAPPAQAPLQQSAAELQVSPATRQSDNSAQTSRPDSSIAAQTPPQQSPAIAQLSPAGWHPGIAGGAQLPMVQAPSQQSAPTVHGLAAGAHAGAPQRPFTQPRPQHPPARAQA